MFGFGAFPCNVPSSGRKRTFWLGGALRPEQPWLLRSPNSSPKAAFTGRERPSSWRAVRTTSRKVVWRKEMRPRQSEAVHGKTWSASTLETTHRRAMLVGDKIMLARGL